MEVDLKEFVRKPYFVVTVLVTLIIVIAMFITQSYWINTGLSIIYKDYKADEILPNNNIPDGVFILSGNYSYISHWINTSNVNCNKDSNVKLLVYSITSVSKFKNVVVLDSMEGCK